MDRREFIQISGIAASGVVLFPSRAQQPGDTLHGDPRRPRFHLLPARNWMNDPNGPIFYRGKYHMFFQYNPKGAVWGNMSWNHAISDDMIHWRLLPVGMTPTPNGPDAAGCFSGSTIAVKRDTGTRVYAIYTGVVRDKEHETIRNEGLKETQCLAWSDDPLLRTWQKRPEPVIAAPPDGLKITGFRDPSVWKKGDVYLMALGAGIDQVGGCVLLYRSHDLVHWQYLHPMVMGSWSGSPTLNPVGDGEMWECPEIFALGDRHVLIYSSLRKVFWQSGVLDPTTLRFTASRGGLLDLGSFYAPKTQLDAQGRRVLWGWIPERRSESEMRSAGWSGLMSLPRILSLDKSGTLQITPLPELESLRQNTLTASRAENSATVNVPHCKGEVLCTGARGQSLTVSMRLAGEAVQIRYTANDGKIFVDGTDSALGHQDQLTVHAFIDGSVAEIFINNTLTVTRRFYYSGDIAPDIIVHAEGQGMTLAGWNLAPISTDRLTAAPANA